MDFIAVLGFCDGYKVFLFKPSAKDYILCGFGGFYPYGKGKISLKGFCRGFSLFGNSIFIDAGFCSDCNNACGFAEFRKGIRKFK